MRVKIITMDRPDILERDVNRFLETISEEKIVKILQSECAHSNYVDYTISIFHKE